MKLAAVRLFVRNLAAARDFYAAQLGLPLQHDGGADGFCVFDVDGIDLVVEAVPAAAPADEQALVGRFSGLSFAVEDIAATHARLLAAGVPFAGPPQRQFWGGTLATLTDPAGNELQLVQYPAGVRAP